MTSLDIAGTSEASTQLGDFCYIKPGTVRYQLKFMKGQSDFQILEDGTLQEYTCGQHHQLTFNLSVLIVFYHSGMM